MAPWIMLDVTPPHQPVWNWWRQNGNCDSLTSGDEVVVEYYQVFVPRGEQCAQCLGLKTIQSTSTGKYVDYADSMFHNEVINDYYTKHLILIVLIDLNSCHRDKRNGHKRFDDIRSKLKKKIQHQRVHATGTGGGPTPQRLILSPLEELLRAKLLPVVVEGLPGDHDIGIYPSQFPPVAPEGHVSPETEQVSSPGSASSTHLEEHDEEDYDDDDDDDAAAAIDTQIQASDHEEVPIETVLPPNHPANTTYDAIVASEGKIVEAENRRHSDLMTVLERMIALQEETVSQLAHLHRVFIEVPKQLQKINTSFEALVVQQTQANYLRMTNVSQFNINTSQAGSVHAGQFSPNSSDLHSPGPNVTGQVADIAVQVPDDILPLPSVQIQQLTPTKEATKTKQDTHETDQPSLVQCLPTCSHLSVGTSPVREQSLPKSPVECDLSDTGGGVDCALGNEDKYDNISDKSDDTVIDLQYCKIQIQ
ncbi:uncharacterized protein LOC142492376 [Ascaphus truei]|uniref:uncharacterized protein LOC142492376 n=1 Tax=Ascaphus truei TaxID=8439 RepID=UPI003F5A06D2